MQYVQYKLLKMMMIIEYSEQKLVNKMASTKTDSPEQTTATQKRLFENTPRTKNLEMAMITLAAVRNFDNGLSCVRV